MLKAIRLDYLICGICPHRFEISGKSSPVPLEILVAEHSCVLLLLLKTKRIIVAVIINFTADGQQSMVGWCENVQK